MKILQLIREKLSCKFYGFVYSFYYRVIFGRELPFANQIALIVRAWEMRQKEGDIPISRDSWETQYLSGQWKYMEQIDELARYSIIVGYIEYLKPMGAILDVGCGEGILFNKLQPYGYSKYLGIDISKSALTKLTEKQDEKTFFVQADAETYQPAVTVDIIVFNETLYYFHDPLKVIERYSCSLAKDGFLIVETYVASLRAMSILQRLKTIYFVVDETRTTHEASSKSWICSVLAPVRTDK